MSVIVANSRKLPFCREGAALLPVARRGVQQLEHDGLSGLEIESGRFFEAKSERAFGELLAARKLHVIARHGY
jgi:hypothetical protein